MSKSQESVNKFLASSVNSGELSLTLKGALLAVVPLVALVIRAAGGEISNDDLNVFVEAVSEIVLIIGTLASSFLMIIGVLRRVYNSFK